MIDLKELEDLLKIKKSDIKEMDIDTLDSLYHNNRHLESQVESDLPFSLSHPQERRQWLDRYRTIQERYAVKDGQGIYSVERYSTYAVDDEVLSDFSKEFFNSKSLEDLESQDYGTLIDVISTFFTCEKEESNRNIWSSHRPSLSTVDKGQTLSEDFRRRVTGRYAGFASFYGKYKMRAKLYELVSHTWGQLIDKEKTKFKELFDCIKRGDEIGAVSIDDQLKDGILVSFLVFGRFSEMSLMLTLMEGLIAVPMVLRTV